MSEPQEPNPAPAHRPTRLAFVVVPLALLPLGLAFLPAEGGMFFVVFGSICLAAPSAGFWIGEMRGDSQAGRAGLGCLGTLALFAIYLIWALVAVPLLTGR